MVQTCGPYLVTSTRSITAIRSQIVTLDGKGLMGRGQHLKYMPYAFTEHGVLMLSSVLRSDRAIEVNIAVVRAFVRLREMLSTHKDLARKLAELEKKYDSQFRVVFEALQEMMKQPDSASKRRIGFAR
jgi:hypothetical protein